MKVAPDSVRCPYGDAVVGTMLVYPGGGALLQQAVHRNFASFNTIPVRPGDWKAVAGCSLLTTAVQHGTAGNSCLHLPPIRGLPIPYITDIVRDFWCDISAVPCI
jgi:hypothetical protein